MKQRDHFSLGQWKRMQNMDIARFLQNSRNLARESFENLQNFSIEVFSLATILQEHFFRKVFARN